MRRLLVLLVLLPACSTALPTRYVLERDVGEWRYRVYQRVLDVEIAVEGNEAVGHTATYVRRGDRRTRSVPVANAFVAVYAEPAQLTAQVRRQLRQLESYELEVRDYGGGRVFYLDGGEGDRWALWVSGRHVVKVGAAEGEDEVPRDLVSAYMSLYPSDLDESGRARDGTPSAGELPEAEAGDEEVPDFLEENAPR
jgi:hypothetical protein